MTRTSYQLDDVGGRLSWSSLYSFIHNLKGDSALANDLGRSTGWEDVLQTNTILADIFDLLMAIYYAMVGKKQRIKPYPRPGANNDKKRIGKGAMPYDQLRKWIKERQGHG